MATVEADYWLRVNGKELDLKIIGRVVRDITGRMASCDVDKVLTPDGLNVLGVIPQDEMEPMRRRLWNAHISATHPLGDGAADIGA